MIPDIILQRTGIDVRAVEQGDDAWHKLRLGVITASEVHNVRAKPRSGKKWPDMKMSYFHTLLAEVCTGVAPEVNAKALAWGKQYENDARALFEFTSGVNVTESPIIYRDESMRTACSPDGLCSDGNGLELKCPFAGQEHIDPLQTEIGSMVYAVKPGDGSAREQAASCQRVIGGLANIAEEYATKRYRSNVINWGMLPLQMAEVPTFEVGDYIYIPGIKAALDNPGTTFKGYVIHEDAPVTEITLYMESLTAEEREIIKAGSLINFNKNRQM